MDDTDEILHELGSYPPILARRVLERLEAAQVPFETEMDDSALADPTRGIKLSVGMSPPGSKIRVFVPESRVTEAKALEEEVFPG